MILFIIFGLTSLLLVALGCYIWTKQAVSLLSNFDEKRIQDRKGMARWAAIFLYIFAVLFLGFGYGIFKFQYTQYEIVPIFVLIPCVLLLTVIYLVGGQRFLYKGFKNHNTNGGINL